MMRLRRSIYYIVFCKVTVFGLFLHWAGGAGARGTFHLMAPVSVP